MDLNDFWTQALCIIVIGVLFYRFYLYGYKQGSEQGAEYTLEMLEKDKILKVDEKGEIWQYDRYYNDT